MTATTAGPDLGIALDHLVVACRTLAAGRAWCEATFGVVPEPGGRHPRMGTHNDLLAIASPRFPRVYLELIAIDPEAPSPGRPRWFDLDVPSLQAAIADEPKLVHWVARCADIELASASLRDAGFDPGRIVDAERMTAGGLLRWRMTIPNDGRRPAAGAVPLLIEWGEAHPGDSLPERGLAIESLQVGGIAAALASQLGVELRAAATPGLSAVLAGPRGRVVLTAPTLAAS